MNLPFKVISTDFDGTMHAEFEDPPIPSRLANLLRHLQARGVVWVINTGRDLRSLMENLDRSGLDLWPDFVVTVEREIHCRQNSRYVGLEPWNQQCHLAHQAVFVQLRRDLPRLTSWVQARFQANIYEDAYSPFCLITRTIRDAEAIHAYLDLYCQEVPELTVVRNDVYARFSHVLYNKGTALAEISRQVGANRSQVVAAGDHLNDLPMLSGEFARWLIAPSNAVEAVKELVRKQSGHVSEQPHGYGLADGLERICADAQLPRLAT